MAPKRAKSVARDRGWRRANLGWGKRGPTIRRIGKMDAENTMERLGYQLS